MVRNSGRSSDPKSLFQMIQGRSDSSIFFFLAGVSMDSIEEERDFRSLPDWEESLTATEDSRIALSLPFPLLDAEEVENLCWSRILMNDSTAALMTSDFSPEVERIDWISKQVSPFLDAPDLNLLTHVKHSSTNGDCNLRVPGGGKPCSTANSLVI